MEKIDKYVRVCDVTSEGMNEGFCIEDGHMYIKNKSDMINHIKSVGYKTLDEAYNDEYYYYTEWYEVFDEQDEYYTKDGKLIN